MKTSSSKPRSLARCRTIGAAVVCLAAAHCSGGAGGAASAPTDSDASTPPSGLDADAGPEASVPDGASSAPDASGPPGAATYWEEIGPWNFFDAVAEDGPDGTCADAVTDPGAPQTMFMGGSNNGAAGGVRKSIDGGRHWVAVNAGLADPRIAALATEPGHGGTVYAGTPTGVFASTDGAATWALEKGTDAFGGVQRSMMWVTVQGTNRLVVSTGKGIAYRDEGGVSWTLSAPPADAPTSTVYVLAASTPGAAATVLYAVLEGGVVYKVTATTAGLTWSKTGIVANTVTVDPTNSAHLLGTHAAAGGADDYKIFESTDGGASWQKLSDVQKWYVAFDPGDPSGKTVWGGGQGGVERSVDGGKTWVSFPWPVKSREGYTHDARSTDVQWLMPSFSAAAPAFCSDQGLARFDATTQSLVGLNGDIKDTIVVSVAVSAGDPAGAHVLTTMWDWGPTASWDDGQSWPATSWYGSEYWSGPNGLGAPPMGEGGQVFALGASADGAAHVLMTDGGQTTYASSDGGKTFAATKLAASGLQIQYDVFDRARDASGRADGTLYLGTLSGGSGTVYRSTDYGQTWQPWGRTYPGNELPTSVAVDPANRARVLVTAGACLYATGDGGKTWSTCAKPSPSGAALRALAFRPDDAKRAVVLTDAGELLRSSDGGATWTPSTDPQLTGALPHASVSRHLAYSPSGKTIVLTAASGDPGAVRRYVFASSDDGATWTDEAHEMTTMQINGVTWDGADLYLATSGQGVLRRKQFEP